MDNNLPIIICSPGLNFLIHGHFLISFLQPVTITVKTSDTVKDVIHMCLKVLGVTVSYLASYF